MFSAFVGIAFVLPLSFCFGVFGFSNIFLPLFFVLPVVVRMAKNKELQKYAILKCFIGPAFLLVVASVIFLMTSYFNCERLYVFGLILGVVRHLFGLFSIETQRDMLEERNDFINLLRKK